MRYYKAKCVTRYDDLALLDGVFEKALLEHLTGTATALPTLHARAFNLLPSLISDAD